MFAIPLKWEVGRGGKDTVSPSLLVLASGCNKGRSGKFLGIKAVVGFLRRVGTNREGVRDSFTPAHECISTISRVCLKRNERVGII